PLLKTFSSVVLLRVQVMIQFAMVLGLVAVVVMDGPLWAVAGFIIAAVGCQGGLVPNNMANALEFFPHMGGTAAAMLGASQFTRAGAISARSAAFGAEPLLPIALSTLACSVGAVLLSLGAPAAVAREKAAAEAAA